MESFRDLFLPGSLTFFKREQMAAAAAFPAMLNIEPTNDCNLRCVMCAREKSAHPVRYMPMKLFRRIMDEAREHGGVRWLALHKDGESLLHPDFPDMAAYAKRGGAQFTHVNTNAQLLTPDLARRIVEAGLDSLTLSVDADTEATYRQVKRGGDLATVWRNAEALLDVRTRLGAVNPVVRAKIIDMPLTRPEIEKFKARWTGLADEVQVQAMHNHAGGVEGTQAPDRRPCSLLWYSLAVNSDGTASTCCLDYARQSLLGDLNHQSLAEIFQGATMARYRRGHKQHCLDDLPPCTPCNAWRASDTIGNGW